jgi:hypothetical protein
MFSGSISFFSSLLGSLSIVNFSTVSINDLLAFLANWCSISGIIWIRVNFFNCDWINIVVPSNTTVYPLSGENIG